MNNSNKNFGIVFSLFFFLIFIYQFFSLNLVNYFLLSFSIILLIISYLCPNILTFFNKIWIKIGEVLGKVISPIVMFLIYVLVIIPTKLILLLFNKKIMNLNINKNLNTYWVKKSDNLNNMDNQF